MEKKIEKLIDKLKKDLEENKNKIIESEEKLKDTQLNVEYSKFLQRIINNSTNIVIDRAKLLKIIEEE